MAGQSGVGGVVKIGANAVAEVRGWQLDDMILKIPAHVAGPGTSRYLVGRVDVSGSLNCVLDDGDATGQQLLMPGASANLTLMYEGEGSGKPQRVLDVIVEQVSESLEVDSPNGRSFTFWSNGTVDRTAQV